MIGKVIIGSARHDERGQISGGRAGDQKQTGKPDYSGEVSLQEWYKHDLGWYVYRAKDSGAAAKIAECMLAACNNPHIGYNQNRNQTLYQASMKYNYDVSQVTEDCETDCARLTRVCVLYAGIDIQDFYTATEPAALDLTGAFTRYTDPDHCEVPDALRPGDILITRSKGHSAVVVEADGIDPEAPYGYIRTTGSVYIRSAPRTSAQKITSVPKDRFYIYTGSFGVDPRGRVWYEIDTGTRYGWISSAYARREE